MQHHNASTSDPPLRAVRTFEAFARHGTVTAAAREMGVSPSAVSHQLRMLEQFLQQDLTLRYGRNLVLTDAGREYYRSIRTAFSVLRNATEHVREKSAIRQITISMIPLFGTQLFIPRVHGFLQGVPDLEVNVIYANHRNYPSDASDISIRFGTGQWPGYRSELLLPGEMAPFCSRTFLERHGPILQPDQLAELPLLHDEERGSWMQWFETAGARRPVRMHGLLLEDGQLTLSAVLADLGCALLREPMVTQYVRSGELVKLFDVVLDDGRDYYLCSRLDSDMSREGMQLYNWLKHGLTAAA